MSSVRHRYRSHHASPLSGFRWLSRACLACVKTSKKMTGYTLLVQAKRSGIPCRNLREGTLTNRHRVQCAGVLTRRAVSSFRTTQLRHDGAAAQARDSRQVDVAGRHLLDFQFFGVTSSGTPSRMRQPEPFHRCAGHASPNSFAFSAAASHSPHRFARVWHCIGDGTRRVTPDHKTIHAKMSCLRCEKLKTLARKRDTQELCAF